METKGFYEFAQLIKDNPAVKSELKALDGKKYEEYCAAFVAIGTKHGYTFDVDEVEEALDEALAEKTLTSGELTDEQLESAAGGAGKGGAIGGIIEGGI